MTTDGLAARSTAARSACTNFGLTAAVMAAELGRRQVGDEVLRHRRQHQGHHVALGHPEFGQTDRRLVGQAIELARRTGQAFVGDEGGAVPESAGRLCGCFSQQGRVDPYPDR